ncbi:MAG: hypothetical protein KatS3mg057_2453 [Herpetosiphonaceae bacterium]|nr:MAG: hypothetical protein KatS3mg057_2453 [Herpetosiphonaceae bacterium]
MKRFHLFGMLLVAAILFSLSLWSYRERIDRISSVGVFDAQPELPPLSLEELRAVSLGTISPDSPLAAIQPDRVGLDFEYVVKGRENPAKREGMKGTRGDREAWYWFLRTYPGTAIPEGVRQRAYTQLMDMTAKARPLALNASWQQVGPAPIVDVNLGNYTHNSSGRTTAIVIHPTDPNIIYVGTA